MTEQPPACLSPSTGSRVAFFGGSFDPPHLGHLAVARAARAALRLDRVLFAPVGAQPLKPRGSTAPFPDRVAMTSLAIAGETGFEISLVDAPASDHRPNYTLETLGALRAALPPGGLLLCLMGADSFVSLSRWHGAPEIPFVASLIVASRPGQQLDDLARFLPRGLTLEPAPPAPDSSPLSSGIELRSFLVRNPAGQVAPFHLLPNLDVKISASEIRKQVHSSAHDPIAARPLLPPAVAEYIRTHRLYRR